jgi:hypothetical protein
MSDKPASRSLSARFFAWFTLRRAVVNTGIFLYCLVLLLAFDFAWSSLTRGEETARGVRIAHPVYDHGFAADFDGYDFWGELRYRLVTNSLGFKDASVRSIQLKPASRRILLIGDSFAEGIGMSFEDSFAGMLQQAGQERSDKIEFLNAGVASYSPSIYYKKIKYLLEFGLQFDEVVVFSDTSDVTDEANSYFCIDDDPKYRAHCSQAEGSTQPAEAAPKKSDFFIDRFVAGVPGTGKTAALTDADALLDRGFGSASSRQVCRAPTSLFGLSRKRKGSSLFRPRFLAAVG